MINVPLREGSFFCTRKQIVKNIAEGGLALFQVA